MSLFYIIPGRSRTVINRDSGMVIQITPRGIKETFGEKNFYKLGRKIKIAKLAAQDMAIHNL